MYGTSHPRAVRVTQLILTQIYPFLYNNALCTNIVTLFIPYLEGKIIPSAGNGEHVIGSDLILRISRKPYLFSVKIRGATAPKSQDRLKWLLPDGSTWGFVVSKALIPQP